MSDEQINADGEEIDVYELFLNKFEPPQGVDYNDSRMTGPHRSVINYPFPVVDAAYRIFIQQNISNDYQRTQLSSGSAFYRYFLKEYPIGAMRLEAVLDNKTFLESWSLGGNQKYSEPDKDGPYKGIAFPLFDRRLSWLVYVFFTAFERWIEEYKKSLKELSQGKAYREVNPKDDVPEIAARGVGHPIHDENQWAIEQLRIENTPQRRREVRAEWMRRREAGLRPADKLKSTPEELFRQNVVRKLKPKQGRK